jgi:hypothetical protein
MAIEVETLRKRADGAMYRSDIRLYRTAGGRVCEEGDPEAAFLLVGAGGSIPAAEAARYGLIGEPEKKAARPPSDKARKPLADKGT